jgi:hypothetical protein
MAFRRHCRTDSGLQQKLREIFSCPTFDVILRNLRPLFLISRRLTGNRRIRRRNRLLSKLELSRTLWQPSDFVLKRSLLPRFRRQSASTCPKPPGCGPGIKILSQLLTELTLKGTPVPHHFVQVVHSTNTLDQKSIVA